MVETLTPYRIIDDILRERERQDEKWGSQRTNPPLYWLGILVEEVGELSKALIEPVGPRELVAALAGEVRKELVQVAAVALCWLEAMEGESDD